MFFFSESKDIDLVGQNIKWNQNEVDFIENASIPELTKLSINSDSHQVIYKEINVSEQMGGSYRDNNYVPIDWDGHSAIVEQNVLNSGTQNSEITGSELTEEKSVILLGQKTKGIDGERKTYSKPRRACPFCKCFFAKLKDHVLSQHKEQPEVNTMTKSSPIKQRFIMSKLIKRALWEQNSPKATKSKKVCISCKGSFHKRYFSKHVCSSADENLKGVSAILIDEVHDDDKFACEILDTFREDGPSRACFHDPLWKLLGKEEFKKMSGIECKERQVKMRIMSYMNSLASLYCNFKENASVADVDVVFKDMFSRKYMCHLKPCLEAADITKSRKMVNFNTLRTACKCLAAMYLVSNDDDSANDIIKFDTILKNWVAPPIKNPIIHLQQKKRLESIRLPKNLPSSETMTLIKGYIDDKVEGLLNDTFDDLVDFVELRRLSITRLVSYNGRRVSEPGHLTIKALQDSFNNKYVDKRALDRLCSDTEKKRLNNFSIAYVDAKNSGKTVDIIIPISLKPALQKLCCLKTREDAGVHPSNPYVFAQVKRAKGPSSGYHDMADVINKACKLHSLTERVTATSVRHLLSTRFEEQASGTEDRKSFYKHLGHS